MHIILLPVLVSAAGLTVTASSLTAHRRAEPARVLRSTATDSLIPDQYVVKMRDAVDGDAVDGAVVDSAMSMLDSAPDRVYTSSVFRGFAAKLDEATLETLRNHPEVSAVLLQAIPGFQLPFGVCIPCCCGTRPSSWPSSSIPG